MSGSKAQGRKILVAEDHEDTLLLMRLMLEQRGHRVVEAADGEEAVEVARRECPDAVLMDLSLPKLDGLAAARRIREDPQMRDAVIVAVTAHIAPRYRMNAMAAGINAFVAKPVDFDSLDDLLRCLIKRR